MYISRIGHEVIVDFLEGNPDRPIVIGSVYHGTNRPPYSLPDEKTQTTIKSNSSKGGGGFNEIRLQDKKGAEQVFIHGEKDFDLRVKNTRKEYIGNERHLTVEKDEYAQVKKSKHQLVTEDFLEKVGGDMNTTVGGDRVVKISGRDHLTIDGDFIMKIGGTTNIKSGKKVVIEAGSEITLKAGACNIVIGPDVVSITGPMVKINSGGSPSSASLPDPPDAPKEAKLPVDAKPGKKDKAPEAQKAKDNAVVLDSNKVKEYESSQAQSLSDASKNGASFLHRFHDPGTGSYISADTGGLAVAEIRNPPGFSDRVKDKLLTDWDRVKNFDRYGENARLDTVMTYTGTAITTGAIGAAGAWKYGLRYAPYIGTAVGKAANDFWGTGQPGWFAAKDKLQGLLEDLNDWWEDSGETD